jgi:hypothetical protein
MSNENEKLNNYIEAWINLENEIKFNNTKLKELYDKRQHIESKINKYSNLTEHQKKIINTPNGIKIKLTTTNINKTLTLKYLKIVIENYFRNNKFIDKETLYKFIVKNRDTYNKFIVKKI